MRFIELAGKRCSIRGYKPDPVPDDIEPLALLPIGFPNAEGREKTRKALDELVRYEHG